MKGVRLAGHKKDASQSCIGWPQREANKLCFQNGIGFYPKGHVGTQKDSVGRRKQQKVPLKDFRPNRLVRKRDRKKCKKKVSSEFVGSCKDKKSSETFVGSCKNNKKVPTKKILTEFVGIFCERKKTRSLSLSLSLSLLSLSLFKMDGKVPSSIKRPTQNVPTKNLGGALADGKDRAIQIGRSESCCQGQGHPTRDHPLAKPHQSPQVDTCSFGRANMRSFQRKQRQMTFWRFSPTVLCRINGALICSD